MPENTHNSKDAGSYLCRVMTRHSQEPPRRIGMCVRLLKRTCFLGPRAETLAKRAVFLHCQVVTAGRGAGGDVLFSVFRSEVDRAQHMQQVKIQTLFQSQGAAPQRTANAQACSHNHGIQEAWLGAHQASSDNHTKPGVCSQVHTPSTAARRMLPSLTPDRFWNEVPAIASFSPSIWPGHS